MHELVLFSHSNDGLQRNAFYKVDFATMYFLYASIKFIFIYFYFLQIF
jgi:hypothetical protein